LSTRPETGHESEGDKPQQALTIVQKARMKLSTQGRKREKKKREERKKKGRRV
jgi:hypothetical protein